MAHKIHDVVEKAIEALPVRAGSEAFATYPAHASSTAFANAKTGAVASSTLNLIFGTTPSLEYSAGERFQHVLEIAERSPPLFQPVLEKLEVISQQLITGHSAGVVRLDFAGQIGDHVRGVAAMFPDQEHPVNGLDSSLGSTALATRSTSLVAPGESESASLLLVRNIQANVARSLIDLTKSQIVPLQTGLIHTVNAVKYAPAHSQERQEGLELLRDTASRNAGEPWIKNLAKTIPEAGPESDPDLVNFRREILEPPASHPGERLLRSVLGGIDSLKRNAFSLFKTDSPTATPAEADPATEKKKLLVASYKN